MAFGEFGGQVYSYGQARDGGPDETLGDTRTVTWRHDCSNPWASHHTCPAAGSVCEASQTRPLCTTSTACVPASCKSPGYLPEM